MGRDDVFPDTASDQPPECLDSVWVCAGMVEHHHGSVLDIVKPPLGRHELVLVSGLEIAEFIQKC